MKINAEIELYIVHQETFQSGLQGKGQLRTVKTLTAGSWKNRDAILSWSVTYVKEFTIEKPEGRYRIKTE